MVARQTLLVPMKQVTATVDVSYVRLERGHFITIATGGNGCVEVVRLADGALQICVDDATLEAGAVHRFEDIYGPDRFKDTDEGPVRPVGAKG